jgi:hypothetical protein
MHNNYKATFSISHILAISIIVAIVLVGAGLAAAMIFGGLGSPGVTSTTSQNISGVVTGYVTVGPSQPVCRQNQSCTVDITGYSLNFVLACTGPEGSPSNSCQTRNYSAAIAPSGHYSALLPAGNYSISGLSPSCKWMGCTTTFPKSVKVEGGMQIVVDLNIDTGIR